MNRRNLLLSILIILLLHLPLSLLFALQVDNEEVIDSTLFFSRYASSLDTLQRAGDFLDVHNAMGRRFTAGTFLCFPASRCLALTNLGLVDVLPGNFYAGLIADLWESPLFSWSILYSPGVSQLSPYLQAADAEGSLLKLYTPIYKTEMYIYNSITAGRGLEFRFGWQHLQESGSNGNLLLMEPGEPVISYEFDLLKDKFQISTNLQQVLFDLVIREELKTLGVGYTWNTGFLKRLFTGFYYHKIFSFVNIGPQVEADFDFFKIDLRGGFVPSAEVPFTLAARIRGAWDFMLWKGFAVPLAVSANCGYNGARADKPFLAGFKVASGLCLDPPKDLFWMGFNLGLSVSINDPDDLVVMPVEDALVITADFGFHFF